MAGGMNKRGTWGSMSDRVSCSAGDVRPKPDLKHCWVSDSHGRLPALLLEWRRTGAGFQGRVVRAVVEEGEWVVVEEWLPASALDRA